MATTLFVACFFGLFILVFGGVAAGMYFLTEEQDEIIGIFAGFACVFATACLELLISTYSRASPERTRLSLTAMNMIALFGLTGLQVMLYMQGRTGTGSLVFTSFFVLFLTFWIAQKWRPASD